MSYPWILSEESGVAKYQKDSEEPLAPTECGMSIADSEKDLLCQLHRTEQTHLLRGRAPNRSQSETQHMPHMEGTSARDKEEVTILIPEKVDFRAESIS